MKTYTQKELKKILSDHEKWLENDGGERADLSESDLRGISLSGINLSGSDLSESDLSWSNLSRSRLSRCNLSGSCLSESDLRGAFLPPPTMLLLADWREVSADLTVHLMRWDAWNHSDGERAFDKWADDGSCPYDDEWFQRAANFYESQDLWIKYGYDDPPSAHQLVEWLFDEKGIKR